MDNSTMKIAALDPNDKRALQAKVAGPAAAQRQREDFFLCDRSIDHPKQHAESRHDSYRRDLIAACLRRLGRAGKMK